MDLVSLETKAENEWIKERLVREKVKYIWTSGRLCDFKGCERADLQPLQVNGWFWTAELQKLAPTTDRQNNDWSPSGGIHRPQPDNRVYKRIHFFRLKLLSGFLFLGTTPRRRPRKLFSCS